MKNKLLIFGIASILLLLFSCGGDDESSTSSPNAGPNVCPTPEQTAVTKVSGNAVQAKFGTAIDLDNLANYSAQSVPDYITKCSGTGLSNAKATLGRVLFYDKELSTNKTVSCASCHQQGLAFSDGDVSSDGVGNGKTERHSMRLINARFADETKFFWDERASSLENQSTQPIQDINEMGFDGSNGNTLESLLTRLSGLDYYQELFTYVYGDAAVTEARMQEALAHFIRSIQSFDSKYDEGRAQVAENNVTFPNFTDNENAGKTLFMARTNFDQNGGRTSGGLGCAGCHRPPEFDIDPDSGNNGVVAAIGGGTDTTVTRAPTLRDMFNSSGTLNGPLMHTGDFTAESTLNHYNAITLASGTDNRLRGGRTAQGQRLNLTNNEKAQLIAFLKTLSGKAVYSDEKWSDPFPSP